MIRKKRVLALTGELKRRGIDVIFLGPSTDLEYIGELNTHPDERVRGLLVGKDGTCVAITPLLYKRGDGNSFSRRRSL